MANLKREPQPEGRVGERVATEAPSKAATKLTTLQLAQQALQSQNKPQTLVDALTEEQRAVLAASINEDGSMRPDVEDAQGKVTDPGTASIVRGVLAEYYEAHKATSADDEAAPAATDALTGRANARADKRGKA